MKYRRVFPCLREPIRLEDVEIEDIEDEAIEKYENIQREESEE